ncbi:hypothetical protein A1351_21670 [Methylosinus sp. R-45379]|nr:hypothetical protein A1351_21670 [Methylosinus sp. R-45379]
MLRVGLARRHGQDGERLRGGDFQRREAANASKDPRLSVRRSCHDDLPRAGGAAPCRPPNVGRAALSRIPSGNEAAESFGRTVFSYAKSRRTAISLSLGLFRGSSRERA